MKHAYISVVLCGGGGSDAAAIELLDNVLSTCSRAHEIVVVIPTNLKSGHLADLRVSGPVTIVNTHYRATLDAQFLAGIARAVGDFILEWQGRIADLDQSILQNSLSSTDHGFELVEIIEKNPARSSTFFYTMANSLRPKNAPIQKSIGRLYSRNVVGQLLAAATFEPQLDVISAELPVRRDLLCTDLKRAHPGSITNRLGDGFSLLAKGTRFGSTIPMLLATVSAVFGIAAAIYGVIFFLFLGKTPAGWTSLMIVIGLGQAAVLAMLGLTWARIDALIRGLSHTRDATVTVEVITPNDLGL
jgi:hypothetical protein